MAKQAVPLNGKVVAITGGARGIGKATASALARKGMRVAIGDLDLELAERTAGEIGAAGAYPLDVTDRASFSAFLDAVERDVGPLYAIVNNAGIMQLGRFVEETDETALRMIDINIHGVLLGMKLAIPRLQAHGSGHVVNIASQAGKAGFAGGATYCATKHAVVGVSEAVRQELRGSGIELSVVMPAVVNTELGSGLGQARGVKTLEPQEVADEIAAALEHPRFDVHVPRSAAAIGIVSALLPRAAREALGRAMKADSVLADPDTAARASYERRAGASHSAAADGRDDETTSAAARPRARA